VFTVVGAHAAATRAPPTLSSSVARRGVLTGFAIGGLSGAIGAGLLVATSDHLVHPIGFGLWLAVTVVGWLGAALYWLVRRPGNRLGLLLLAVAVCTVVMSLQGANQPLLHGIGVLADWLFVLAVFYVVFAFPEGRIETRVAWALLGATALERLGSYVPSLLFSPTVSGNFPQAACNAACPANGFMIADRPTIADGLLSSEISIYVRLAVRSAICVYLIYRLATATKPRRRALVPVYVPVLIAIAPILVFYLVRLGLVHLDAGALSTLSWVGTSGIGTLPYGFLLSVVVSTLFAAAALKMIVSRLVKSPSAAQLRATLADALDDRSLALGFRLEREGGFVDSSGRPLASMPPPGQSSSLITQNGETVAVIMHDAALDTDPELVAAAGQATLLAIENGRLTAELGSTTTELQATRARVVTAGDAERRRIERDLHDGAQQHLVALSIKVGLAREVADPEAVARLDGMGKELDEILEQLRDLAHGLYPTVLRDLGLQAALVALVGQSVSPAKVEAGAIGRCSEEVEAAVYFCCAESLQNIDKHAGLGTTAVIRLWEHDGRLLFEIVDDGAGFDVESARHPGHGLANLSERITAHAGTLEIESTPGRGTTIRANIPVADAAAQRVGPTPHSGPEGRNVFSSVAAPATQRSDYE
jgi:signal transduction histidine kinase